MKFFAVEVQTGDHFQARGTLRLALGIGPARALGQSGEGEREKRQQRER
jgi:hypothetical protein